LIPRADVYLGLPEGEDGVTGAEREFGDPGVVGGGGTSLEAMVAGDAGFQDGLEKGEV
jgi:hypothetical protein